MSSQLNIHRITDVKITVDKTLSVDAKPYTTLDIVAKDEDGHETTIVLFAKDVNDFEDLFVGIAE